MTDEAFVVVQESVDDCPAIIEPGMPVNVAVGTGASDILSKDADCGEVADAPAFTVRNTTPYETAGVTRRDCVLALADACQLIPCEEALDPKEAHEPEIVMHGASLPQSTYATRAFAVAIVKPFGSSVPLRTYCEPGTTRTG